MTAQTHALSDEEFLARFGDTIDDRITELLEELLDERNLVRRSPWLPWLLTVACLALAVLAAAVLLR